ncbi:hypothetical protein [Streptomyces sp. NPDC005077]|uniref:hypothetical protein n=1 Tax=unclassified Streptomyces TaxID=2593676 RepID=UPI0033B53C71
MQRFAQTLQPVRRAVTYEFRELSAVLPNDRLQQFSHMVTHPPPQLDPREFAIRSEEEGANLTR